jgi:hypothetical protein
MITWPAMSRPGNVDVFNGYIDGMGRGSAGFYFPILELSTCRIWNLKVWDTVRPAGAPAFSAAGVYLERFGSTDVIPVVENCTFYNSFLQMDDEPLVGRNIVAFNNGTVAPTTDFVTNRADLNVIENCADTDGRIDDEFPGQNTNTQTVVYADEFQSLDDTNSRFLYLVDGELNVDGTGVPVRGRAPHEVQFTDLTDYSFPGILGTAGIEPEEHTTDIEDLAIPSPEGYYSIGCHQGQIT